MNLELLRQVCVTPGAPGFEDKIRDFIIQEVAPLVDAVRVDNMGSVIAIVEDKNTEKTMMAAAHMDEIGFMVRHIDDKGFIKFLPLGGFDAKTLTAQRVIVHGKKDLIGVMGVKPIHVMSPAERTKLPEVTDFFIDLGMSKEEVEKYVSVGDSVTRERDLVEDLVIIISQSGETSDTLAALKLAKSRGVPVLAIVNVVGSSIARAADYVLYTYAGPEIAVASTKAYMVQMCVLYLFALRLAYARGAQTEAETRRLTAELLRASEVIKPRLADCEQIKYLASRFVNTQSCFFIGRGFDYALSLEGSLKLKEISYVHSDAYAAGELKHGTISLITDGVPVIALATQKQVYEKTISNAKETKSRGAKVLLFTTKDAVVPEGVADYVVRLDEYEDLLMPLQLIVPLQLFAYYMAVLRGCDVDKPRNLAKSVTVE